LCEIVHATACCHTNYWNFPGLWLCYMLCYEILIQKLKIPKNHYLWEKSNIIMRWESLDKKYPCANLRRSFLWRFIILYVKSVSVHIHRISIKICKIMYSMLTICSTVNLKLIMPGIFYVTCICMYVIRIFSYQNQVHIYLLLMLYKTSLSM
jgi:hypothetical protein